MFKRITIELAGPICTCDEQDLAWQPAGTDKNGKPVLELTCNTCGTKLVVSNKKFVASFKFDKPYPGKKAEESKTKVKAPPTTDEPVSNVIPFPTKEPPPNKTVS